MKKFSAIILNFLLLAVPALLWASEGLEVPEELGRKVDLTNLGVVDYFLRPLVQRQPLGLRHHRHGADGPFGFLPLPWSPTSFLKMIGMETHKMEHHE